jgi:hypothetical protein
MTRIFEFFPNQSGLKGGIMATCASKLLDTNDRFPEMDLKLLSGETLRIPDGLGNGYGVILLYRGYW